MDSPLSVHVDFIGKAAFLPDEECIRQAAEMFPNMKVYEIFGQRVHACRESSGSVRCAKSVCLYIDIPENPIWETGCFADSKVVEIR